MRIIMIVMLLILFGCQIDQDKSGIKIDILPVDSEIKIPIDDKNPINTPVQTNPNPEPRKTVNGNWVEGEGMRTSRTEVAAASLNGKIYVLGGFIDGKTTDVVEVFDAEWNFSAPMPIPLDHTSVVVHSGKLYVIGGYKSGWEPSENVFRYDPANDKWTRLSHMPTARGALTSKVIDGKIYAIGGFGNVPLDTLEIYDIENDKWYEQEGMSRSREHLTSAVVEGRLYVIGGRRGGLLSNLDTIEVYDPSIDDWKQLNSMPTARGGLAAAVLDGKIHVFGGENPKSTYSEHEIYDPKLDIWDVGENLPTPRHGLAAVTLNDRIHVLSGGDRPGFHYTNKNEIYSD